MRARHRLCYKFALTSVIGLVKSAGVTISGHSSLPIFARRHYFFHLHSTSHQPTQLLVGADVFFQPRNCSPSNEIADGIFLAHSNCHQRGHLDSAQGSKALDNDHDLCFLCFSYFACEYVVRKSLDDFRQSVCSPSFMLALQRNILETLCHEMKYDLFFSFLGGYLIHPSGIGQDFGKCLEKMENDRDYQAVSENRFNNIVHSSKT